MFEHEPKLVGSLIQSSGLITSESTAKLDEALAKAQAEFPKALKTSENPAFKRDGKVLKYADISATIDVLREPLTKHGIVVTQWPTSSSDDRLHLLTRVSHKGEFMQAEFSAPVVKRDPQGYGSALTYLRRYTLQSILGIATEDDDGNEASGLGQAKEVNAAEVALRFAVDTVAKRTAKLVGDDLKREAEARVKEIGADGQKLMALDKILERHLKPVNQAILDANGKPDEIKRVIEKFKTEIRKDS